MTGAAIGTTLELWALSLRDVKARYATCSRRKELQRERIFLDGLPGEERRRTGWMRAEAAGDPGPWRQQAILGQGRWATDGLRDIIVREYVVETLATQDAVLVIDETGFLKPGKAFCGVARQYSGSAGKITNCQIGAFAAYVSAQGHAFRAMPLSIVRSICPRVGPAIQPGWLPHTFLRSSRSPPSRL